MRSITALVTALLLFTSAAMPAAAQKRPDFSGTWVEDESQRKSPYDKASGSGVKAMGGPPPDSVITQTPEQITIQRTLMSQTIRMTYDLTGKESVNRTGAQTHTTRSRWEGNKIVTEGSIYQITTQGERNWKLTEVRSMNPKGEMVLETTQVDEDGKSGTVVRVFKRR